MPGPHKPRSYDHTASFQNNEAYAVFEKRHPRPLTHYFQIATLPVFFWLEHCCMIKIKQYKY